MAVTLFDVVIAALLQGMAQALPLGGQGHLLLLGFDPAAAPARLAVSAAAHVGAALAVCLYLWRDCLRMGQGLARLVKGRQDAGGRLLLQIVTGTVPALGAAWFLAPMAASYNALPLVATLMAAGGLALLIADHLGVTVRRVEHLGWGGAFIIGILQLVALFPGISRTGITITVARLMGFERIEAARFALLLGVPAFLAHAGWSLAALTRQTELIFGADLAVATLVSGLGTLAAVALMMAWVERRSFAPFALWRIVFGIGFLGWAWWG